MALFEIFQSFGWNVLTLKTNKSETISIKNFFLVYYVYALLLKCIFSRLLGTMLFYKKQKIYSLKPISD